MIVSCIIEAARFKNRQLNALGLGMGDQLEILRVANENHVEVIMRFLCLKLCCIKII